jgi:hypothetical protein
MIGRIPGWAKIVSALLFAIGLLFAIAEFESPDLVLWTGKAVAATEVGSIVSYSYAGANYSFDARDRQASDPPIPVVVYVDPHMPGAGVLNKPAARWAEAALVLGPFVAGIALVVGATRRSARRMAASERARARGEYGAGFPSGSIERIARGQRGGGASPGSPGGPHIHR